MISITKLHFSYRDSPFSLQVPDLNLPAGQSAVIVGPSGSGKTTLLHLMAGILPAASGEIMVGDTSVHNLNDVDRRLFRLLNIGLVFQDFQLIDYLPVVENVLLPCRLHPSISLTDDLRERAMELLASAGISSLGNRPVTRLSQGERQRVAICRALLLSPKLVLADEPTGNLDPATTQKIVQLLLQETSRAKASLIMVTHDHSLLPSFDRVIPFEPFVQPTNSASKTAGAAS